MLVKEVAERLNVHTNTIRAWCRDGKIQAIKPAGDKLGYRISEVEVARLETLLRGEVPLVKPKRSYQRRAKAVAQE